MQVPSECWLPASLVPESEPLVIPAAVIDARVVEGVIALDCLTSSDLVGTGSIAATPIGVRIEPARCPRGSWHIVTFATDGPAGPVRGAFAFAVAEVAKSIPSTHGGQLWAAWARRDPQPETWLELADRLWSQSLNFLAQIDGAPPPAAGRRLSDGLGRLRDAARGVRWKRRLLLALRAYVEPLGTPEQVPVGPELWP
jgi:hypothetical protein